MKTSPLNFGIAEGAELTALIRLQGYHFDRKARIVTKDGAWVSCYYCKMRITRKNFCNWLMQNHVEIFFCKDILCRIQLSYDDDFEDYHKIMDEIRED